ncbi:NAD-dependent epimerase/dehydratase family protein [Natranaeroarchaeum sulfidigenes]|uniref:Nucleoside-diphosphate-sugar epimerase n=1 Tax=Natranaeroarchaeum sulfidigenes TaxID=2784880 RepID=A0A897MS35_9EURY|nr:NAD-dependent epimerase/dehydratase family protein [Natranaeroarchaeum sulfidigenes]QSG01833.1 Nucleoside-diphosphate-sugar epimerase [Natranaeroarchaeum sulfidigenes]
MDVLIIGGTGLISTEITRQLVDAGHDVVCFTRGETDAAVPDVVEFVHGDRDDHEEFVAQVGDLDVDCVIDMVCFDADQAKRAVDAFAGEIDQYIFTSTIDVYSRPLDTNPVTEDAPREPPTSEYGANKAAAEDVFVEADGKAFASTIIRPWSTYGDQGPVLHTFGDGTYFLDRIRKGKPIVVHGDGTSLWGPCHREDVARAFVNAVGNETAYGETYHVTSEEVITWNQYYEIVADALDAPEPELVHIPTEQLLEADPERRHLLENHTYYATVFDNSKARRELDFEYTTSFSEGVSRAVEWLDAHDKIEPWDSERDDEIVDAWREAMGAFQSIVNDEA